MQILAPFIAPTRLAIASRQRKPWRRRILCWPLSLLRGLCLLPLNLRVVAEDGQPRTVSVTIGQRKDQTAAHINMQSAIIVFLILGLLGLLSDEAEVKWES